MALPKHVEALIKETEELEKQLQEAPEEPEALEPSEEAPEAEPVKPDEEPVAKPEIAEEEAEKPQQAEAEPKTDELAKAEQRYKTLQGMFDAEKRKNREVIDSLSEKISTLESKLTAQVEATQKAEAKLQYVTDDDVRNFGEDLVDFSRRAAREEGQDLEARIEARIAAVQKENEELRQQLNQSSEQAAVTSFEQRLHRIVPDFDQVNTDPRWIAWLDEYDAVLRGPRRSVAEMAYGQGDAEAVAHYVQLFKDSIAPVAEVEEVKARKAEEVERQIQPTRTAQTQAPVSKQGKVYSDADIRNLFSKVANLDMKGFHDDARKLEAEIDRAYAEGRVR